MPDIMGFSTPPNFRTGAFGGGAIGAGVGRRGVADLGGLSRARGPGLLLLAMFVALGGGRVLLATPQETVVGPWQVGDSIQGWSVTEVIGHPEYIRIGLARGGAKTGLEVVRSTAGGPLETGQYRVQPRPDLDTPPDRPLLEAALIDLAAWERGDHEALRRRDPARPRGHPGGISRGLVPLSHWLLPAALALLIPLWLGLRALRRETRGRLPLLAFGAAALFSLVIARLIPVSVVPTSLATPLHEGGTDILLAVLHGQYAYVGAFYRALLALFVGDVGGLALLNVVKFHIALWFLAAGMFGVILRPIVGTLGAVAGTVVVFLIAPQGLHGAVSEIPAALLWNLLLLIVLVGGSLSEPGQSGAARAVALVLGWLLVLAVSGTRIEFLPVAAALNLSFQLRAVGPSVRVPVLPRWGLVALFGGGLVVALVLLELIPHDPASRFGWMIGAWRPTGGGWRQGPMVLSAMLAPGLLFLFCAGVVESLRAPLRTGFVGILVPLLWLLYAIKVDWGVHVMFRYSTLAWPVLGLVWIEGVRWGARALGRVGNSLSGGAWWPSRGVRAALVGALVIACVWPPAGALKVDAEEERELTIPRPLALMDFDRQRAARFVMGELRRREDLTLVTRLSNLNMSQPDRGQECGPAVFGGRRRLPVDICRGVETIRDAVRNSPGPVLCYRGLDANLVDGEDCAMGPAAEEDVVARATWLSRPHGAARMQGHTVDEVVVSVYRCDPEEIMHFTPLRSRERGGRCRPQN